MKKGRIFQINASSGGVPKLPIRAGEVNNLGLLVDDQRNKKHHGGPERALCLYGLERIQALQENGNPIYPGAIGENITLSGFDWEQLVPGVQLRLGDSLHIEITSYAVPCLNIRDAFLNHKIGAVSQKSNPGWARTYAKVLTPGHIQVGDLVEIVA